LVQGTGVLGLGVVEKRDFYKRDNRVIKWNKGEEKSVEIVKGSV
jgi:hypothetical protein